MKFVTVLLDSGATELVMKLEFARKQGFKLKKNNICMKYKQFLQQEGTYWAYSRGQYLLSGAQGKNRNIFD